MNAATPHLDADQRAFLAVAMRAFLFANRRDGSPTGWPMTLLWHGDDAVYFNTYLASAKAKVLARDPRVGVLALHGARALAISGDAVPVPRDEAAPMFASMVRTDGFVPPEQAARTVRRLVEGKRGLYRVRPREARWLPVGAA